MGATRTATHPGPTRVALLDDHPAVRMGLERLLGREPGLDAIAVLADQDDLWTILARERIDVVVLDLSLARGDGMSVCQRIKQLPDPPAVLIYSAYAGDGIAVSAAVAQADALVDKAQPVEALLDAIRRLARGERLIREPEAELLAAASARLHSEDVPLLALLIHGARSHEIADALQMRDDEVRRRARRIIGRLQRGTPRLRPEKADSAA